MTNGTNLANSVVKRGNGLPFNHPQEINVNLLRSACALAAIAACSSSFAAPINTIAPGSLTGSQVTTFDDVAGGSAPGTNYNGVFVSGGVSFAERFVGQSLSTAGGFDVLSGAPGAALALQLGASDQNLNIFVRGASQVLTGLGPTGFPNFGAIGEGSFAALFSTDQSEFGFDLVGGDGGSATVNFFRRNGSLIDAVVINSLSDQRYAFARDGNVFDIGGISIHNNDVGGIGFDNLRFNVPSTGGGTVPEPATLALVGLALAGIGLSRRKA